MRPRVPAAPLLALAGIGAAQALDSNSFAGNKETPCGGIKAQPDGAPGSCGRLALPVPRRPAAAAGWV